MNDSNSVTTGKGEHRAKIIVALIAALATILAAYFQFSPKLLPGEQKQFTGRVSDARTKKHIHGAKVTLEAQGVPPVIYTDSEGIFTFPLKGAINDLRIRVEANGYGNYDRRINPAAKGSSEIEEIRIEPTTSTGGPVVSATITFHDPQTKADEKSVDKRGNTGQEAPNGKRKKPDSEAK